MRPGRFELPRVSPQDPKSCAYTNSATVANNAKPLKDSVIRGRAMCADLWRIRAIGRHAQQPKPRTPLGRSGPRPHFFLNLISLTAPPGSDANVYTDLAQLGTLCVLTGIRANSPHRDGHFAGGSVVYLDRPGGVARWV